MGRYLSPQQRRDISRLKAEGRNHSEIARMVQCSRNSVLKHLREAEIDQLKHGTPNELPLNINIHDDKALANILEEAMRYGRPSEKTQAVIAALKLRSERTEGNPAAEPMTEEEDREFKRYLREDVYPDLCDGCREKATAKQVVAASAETEN